MKTTIYLHIGSGKTGTTSIQGTLFNNKKLLRKHGVLYFSENNINLSHVFMWQENMNQDIEDVFKKLKNDVQQMSRIENIIISSEQMMGLPQESLHIIKNIFESNNFDIKIVAYIRNQVEHLPTHFLQKQKDLFQPYYGELDQFFSRYKNIYCNEHFFIMSNYEKVFGRENIAIKIYDKDFLKNGDVVDDFMDQLNLDYNFLRKVKSSNPSLIAKVSKLITTIDNIYPCLLNKGSKEFNFRQDVIIKTLLEVSQEYSLYGFNENIELSLKQMTKLISMYFSEKNKGIADEVSNTINLLNNSGKYSLMTDELKNKLLDYYRQSNFDFAQKYLSSEQKAVFLKNYPESTINDLI